MARSGRARPDRVARDDDLATWQRLFLDAAVTDGFPLVDDLGAPSGRDGTAPFHENIVAGVRWNAAFAFLDPIRQLPNFQILEGTIVDHLVINDRTATAVKCVTPRGTREVHAKHFLLCAGVYGSPAVILRSGIGPASHLQGLGILVVADLPGVGANLHDHPGIAVHCTPRPEGQEAVAGDLRERRLYQSQVGLRADGGNIHVLPYQALREGQWSFEILAFLMRPKSRGFVRLRDRDPASPPVIDFGYLTDPDGHDLRMLGRGLTIAQRLASKPPLTRLVEVSSDTADWNEYVRNEVAGYGHAVGTCQMGRRDSAMSVTLGSGRVVNTENVWVADASSIPVIPAANTNLTCILLGWMGGRAVAEALYD